MWNICLATIFVCIFYTNYIQATYNSGIKTRIYERDPITTSQVYHHHSQQFVPSSNGHYQYSNNNNNDENAYQTSITQNYASSDNAHRQEHNEGNQYYQQPQHYHHQHHQQHNSQQQPLQPIYERRENSQIQSTGNWKNSENSINDYYTGCPSGHTGQLPYAYDCRRFLNCWHGRGHIQSCSVGTVFNPETLECDRPDKVKCEAALGVLGVQSAERQQTSSTHGDLKHLKQPNYRAGRYTDTTTDNVDILCPTGVQGLQPHPSDCNKFVNCANGNVHIQQCGPGTAFSVSMQVCDFKNNVDCSGRDQGSVETISLTSSPRQVSSNQVRCPPYASGLYPHPYDCAKFLQCSNGETYIQNCGSGTGFDSLRLICDYKEKVKCGPGSTWDSTESAVVTTEFLNTQQSSSSSSTSNHHNDLPHTADILCLNGITGLFPYPFDYTKFINCKNGNTAIQNCVPSTAFSISKGYCESLEDILKSDHVMYIVSQVNYEYSQTLITCPPGTEGIHLYPFNAEKYVKCIESQMAIVTCSPNQVFSITRRTCLPLGQVLKYERVRLISELQTSNPYRITEEQYNIQNMVYCPGGLSGTYPHPFDSAKYVKCVKGRLFSESCSSGEAFSLSRKACSLKEEINTDDRVPLTQLVYDTEITHGSIDGLTYLMCPPGVNGYFLHPFDCTKYLKCSHGSTQVDTCLNGAVFSISRKECISRDKVQAYDRVEYMITTANEFSNESVDHLHQDLGISCSPGTFGIFAHPDDCHKYVRCANGRISVENCAPGQVFSLTRSFCHTENEVQNYDRSSYTRGHTITQSHQSRQTSTNTGSYNPINQPPVFINPPSNVLNPPLNSELSPAPANEVSCLPGVSGRYPHPYDCTKFLMCSNGVTHVQECGPGTAWNNAMELCDFKDKAGCSQSGSSTSSSTSKSIVNTQTQIVCPVGIEGLYQHPYDWHKYLSCTQGQTYVMDCGPGTVFSISRKNCDLDANVVNTDRCNNGVYSTENDYTNTQNYNNRDPKINGGSATTQWSYEGTQYQPTPQTQTHTTQEFSGNRWTNMNVPRPQGTAYEQSGTWQHTTNTHHTNPQPTRPEPTPVWSGTAAHVDQRAPTHTVIYEEGSFEPNREQHNLIGITTTKTGNHETSTAYSLHQAPLESEPIVAHTHNTNWHKHHQHAPHHSKVQHSREYHQKHPNLPNPFDVSSDSEIPYNPRAESTTTTKNVDIDLRGGGHQCVFDCDNGKCVEQHQVCDGVNNCGNRKDEQQCENLGYEVRLTGGESSHMGRVEVKILGKWGYVCDDKFGLHDADVVCRELGFKMGAMEVRGNSYYPPTDINKSFAMDEVECKGNETSLKDCYFKGWGVNNCGPDEVVGVVCKVPKLKCPDNYWLCTTSKECIPTAFLCDVTPDCGDGSDESEQVCNAPIKYRLEGGRTQNEGRLEVFYRAEWGTVCDDDFGLKEAQVVCNSFGLYGKPEIVKNIYGPGSGPIWLDQVSCLGNETEIDKCNHWSWGENNCNHTEDVGLKCTAGPKPNPASTNKAVTTTTARKHSEFETSSELEQSELDDLSKYQGLWQRSSKAVQTQKQCGHFKSNLFDEYDHPEERVINGSIAKRGRHPWQATIRTRGRGGISSHWCGAVIISKKLILTAAHCLAGYPKGSYFVRMGDHYANIAESSEVDSNVENWYIHEKFRDEKHMNNDIALILLKNPVHFNDYVQPICLPEKGADIKPNRMCTISGWGSIKSGTSTPSNILRSAQVPLLADEVCHQKNVYANAMTEGMFCAGFLDESVDACDGDSGGPLVCSDDDGETLYGIISWGQHCGYANHPGVYVRVEKYIDWIYDKINLMMQQGKL